MSFTRILLLALALSAVVEVSRSEPTVTKQAAKAGFRAALRCKNKSPTGYILFVSKQIDTL